MIYENVVIGTPLIKTSELLAKDEKDYSFNEFKKTLFTTTRFLPKVMVEAGIVSSTSEVRRNKPELVKTLNNLDFLEIKWGKKRLFIVVGEDLG